MDIRIYPRKLQGTLAAIPSKSQAHRLLICAAFADRQTVLICPETNQDIEATAGCLRALGAQIQRTPDGYMVTPVSTPVTQATLDCKESGSTLRFLLPVAGALGVDTTFKMAGRLPQRPLSPLWEEMERMGCVLSRPTNNTIHCTGKLRSGNYEISGNISSQFVSGLLFAMALIAGASTLRIIGTLESKPYVDMTQLALQTFGISTDNFCVCGGKCLSSPKHLTVEGDWSNAAFFLAAKEMGNPIAVTGLDPESPQGDRAAAEILKNLHEQTTICAVDIPDLVPILAVAAGTKAGAVFTHIGRLRLKESDRIATVAKMLKNLGGQVQITEHTLSVSPFRYHGGTVDSAGDHRIAMAAAIAATVADAPVTILGAECVSKSYPSFWEEYRRLGGYYEQYIR